jgi:ABC-type nitrate/sulfonate/bicarbonate transport system substrate-binding protein
MLMMVLIASCGGGTDESTSTSAAGATTTSAAGSTSASEPPIHTKFTVLLSAPDPYSFFEPLVAISEGFFRKRGLEVETVVVNSTEGAITGLASGNGNVVDGDLGAYLRAAAIGQFHPIAFYMRDDSGVFDILVPMDSPIQKVEDLDGKVIGVNSEEDPGASLVLSLNPTLGITPKMLVVEDPMGALAALERGEIAAYSGADGDVAPMLARGIQLRSVVPASIRAINGGDGYWSTRELMDDDPAAFRAFVAGLQEGRAYIGQDPQKLVDWANSVEPILPEDMAYNLALATVVISQRPTYITPVGYIMPDLWQTWWDGLVKVGVIDPAIGKPTDFYTNEFFAK